MHVSVTNRVGQYWVRLPGRDDRHTPHTLDREARPSRRIPTEGLALALVGVYGSPLMLVIRRGNYIEALCTPSMAEVFVLGWAVAVQDLQPQRLRGFATDLVVPPVMREALDQGGGSPMQNLQILVDETE